MTAPSLERECVLKIHHPATIDELCAVMIADSLGRPPLTGAENLPLIETLRTRAHELNLRQNPPAQTPPRGQAS